MTTTSLPKDHEDLQRLARQSGATLLQDIRRSHGSLGRHNQHDDPGLVPSSQGSKVRCQSPILAKGRVQPDDKLLARWKAVCTAEARCGSR